MIWLYKLLSICVCAILLAPRGWSVELCICEALARTCEPSHGCATPCCDPRDEGSDDERERVSSIDAPDTCCEQLSTPATDLLRVAHDAGETLAALSAPNVRAFAIASPHCARVAERSTSPPPGWSSSQSRRPLRI